MNMFLLLPLLFEIAAPKKEGAALLVRTNDEKLILKIPAPVPGRISCMFWLKDVFRGVVLVKPNPKSGRSLRVFRWVPFSQNFRLMLSFSLEDFFHLQMHLRLSCCSSLDHLKKPIYIKARFEV